MGFVDGPTPVQKMAITAILQGTVVDGKGGKGDGNMQSVAFAAATGFGKTLVE